MEEVSHIVEVLEAAKQALSNNDSIKLKDLSNQTLHSASTQQDHGSIAIAVLVYTISKLIERKENMRLKLWNKFVKRFNSYLSLAVIAILEGKIESYESYLEQSRKSIESISVNLRPYIQEVLRKASINKASRIYEHGISLGQTAKLLGVTQWELAEYTSQSSRASDSDYNRTVDARKRAQTALEFFS